MRRAPVVAAAVAGCGFVAGVFPVFESDLSWPLATGRRILEHGALTRAAPFRFTADAAPWDDHEWLFQVAARGVEAAGGLPALILLRACAGVCVVNGDRLRAGLDRSRVRFVEMKESEIDWYVATGEPLDKAGAYHVDGLGALFIEAVVGSPSGIAGLPVRLLLELARGVGLDLDVASQPGP